MGFLEIMVFLSMPLIISVTLGFLIFAGSEVIRFIAILFEPLPPSTLQEPISLIVRITLEEAPDS